MADEAVTVQKRYFPNSSKCSSSRFFIGIMRRCRHARFGATALTKSRDCGQKVVSLTVTFKVDTATSLSSLHSRTTIPHEPYI
ncbi:hypothetical protein T4E_9651 [Trichinella pseudospiralis]|uniref:Uncharacterized protein n=1 Tax=Trichinella pseudospiralis TaxID=6337 RepID=A0A0V0YC44_TRIPS|nr:hypothetical protein T4E_9651 [Trichinella pseudospiralis]